MTTNFTRPLFPKIGTPESIVLSKLIQNGDKGVTVFDFVQHDWSEEYLHQIIENLKNGMFESEEDKTIKLDA